MSLIYKDARISVPSAEAVFTTKLYVTHILPGDLKDSGNRDFPDGTNQPFWPDPTRLGG